MNQDLVYPMSDEDRRVLKVQLRVGAEESLTSDAILLDGVLNHLTEDDFQRMLRGNLLREGGTPCEPESRSVAQRTLGLALDPTPWPSTCLRCPLEERHESGAPLIPCGMLLQQSPTESALPQPFRALKDLGLEPCHLLYEYLPVVLTGVLGFDPRQPQDLLPAAQLPALAAALPAAPDGPAAAETLRAQLRFLCASGRLPAEDLYTLLEYGALGSQAHFLPCRDEEERVLFLAGDDQDVDIEVEHTRCPLQVRGLLGDGTTPCAEALRPQPAPLIEAARLRYGRVPPGADSYPRVLKREQLPRSAASAASEPGGPDDPVVRLGLRPCVMLGRLYALTAYPLLRRVAEEGMVAGMRETVRDEAAVPEDFFDDDELV